MQREVAQIRAVFRVAGWAVFLLVLGGLSVSASTGWMAALKGSFVLAGTTEVALGAALAFNYRDIAEHVRVADFPAGLFFPTGYLAGMVDRRRRRGVNRLTGLVAIAIGTVLVIVGVLA